MRRSGLSPTSHEGGDDGLTSAVAAADGTRYHVVALVSEVSTSGSQGLTTTVKRPETRFGKTNRSWLPSASTLTRVYPRPTRYDGR